MELGIAAKFIFENRRQSAVEFDCVQFPRSGKQMTGERASTRPDLDDTFSIFPTGSFGDASECTCVFEEMLTESARQTSV